MCCARRRSLCSCPRPRRYAQPYVERGGAHGRTEHHPGFPGYSRLRGVPVNCPAAEGGTLQITSTRSPLGLAISGEIDESTYDHLVGALDRLADGPGEIHVWLAGVEYCDLAGLRAILSLAGSNGQSRCVVLHDVPPASREALRILGWDTTSGLTIDERQWQPTTRPRAGPGSAGRPRHYPDLRRRPPQHA